MKRLGILLLILAAMLTCCTTVHTDEPPDGLTGGSGSEITLSQLNEDGRKIGVLTGAKADYVTREQFPNAEVLQYVTVGDGFIAVKTGKIDAFCFDRNVMRYTAAENPDLMLIDETIARNDLAIGVSPDKPGLLDEVNTAIRKLGESGVVAEMEARWLGNDLDPSMPDVEAALNPYRTLVVGTSHEDRPMSYLDADGNPAGFDVEYAMRLARELGAEIEIRTMDWNALIPSLQSGKIDLMIADLNVTEERREFMLLSDPYVYTDIVMMVRKPEGYAPPGGEVPVNQARIGAMTGSTGEMFAEKNYPDAEINRYDSIPDAVFALQAGKLDYVVTAYTNALGFVRNNRELEIAPGALLNEGAAIAVKKEETKLLQDISGVLENFRADGTLDDIISRWIKEDGGAYERREIPFNPDGEVLTVGVAANREPMCFIEGGNIVGLDCELIERIAYELGMRVEYMDMQFSALIAALESGKVRVVISNVTATEERKLKVNFTEDYFQNPQVLLKVKDQTAEQAFRAEDFAGKKIAVTTGTIFDQYVLNFIPGAVPVYFNNLNDSVAAMMTDKIDAICNDDAALRKLCAQNPGLKLLEPCVTQDDYGVVCSKEDDELLYKLNEFIAMIKSDGTYDDMLGRWLDTAESPPMPAIAEGTGATLRFGTSGHAEGFSHYSDGEVTGFDVEFAKRFAAYMDMKLEISVMDFGGLLPAVQSGKIDFAANLFTITEERKQSVSFTEPYYTGGAAICVYDAQAVASPSFLDSIQKSFTQNLIVENRWRMIADGLGVSLVITVCAFALATLMGFGVCFLRMSRSRLLGALGYIYVAVLRGTPVVVLLMITYYVIFAKSSVSGVFVAVIAFGFNGAAFIGEIIRSAILTVDKGQVEAARSMGFSKAGVFFTVTFPQAVRVALPVYKSEFISLFKMTSVVGYIAILDLTKAGDIIRSRTYDAFFPLIVVALVYLITASLIVWLFELVDRLTNKRLRRGKL